MVIRPILAGVGLGAAVSALLMWAFYVGSPIFDTIRDHDTIHHI
ncbi:hypothetical protein [Mycolicibacterium peregrinum]|nr:hypothetical protein [Mycolicibacterium peregrinum]